MAKQKRLVQRAAKKTRNNKRLTNAERKAARRQRSSTPREKPTIVAIPDGMYEIVGAINHFIKEWLQKASGFSYFRGSCRVHVSTSYSYTINSPIIACFKDGRILSVTRYAIHNPDILALSFYLHSDNIDYNATTNISYSSPDFFDELTEFLNGFNVQADLATE